MTRCAKCIALGLAPREESAGAHLREAVAEPMTGGLRSAQPGVRHHDLTALTMFRCPDDQCGDRWWRETHADGSFVEWREEGASRC
jgi:hypothetical protein